MSDRLKATGVPERQNLKSGNNSTNIQAQGSVYVGMQYADIRQLFLDLFQQNYETLLEDANREAERRAAEVVDAVLNKLAELPPSLVENLREPGIQRALVQAQVEHATTGDHDDADIYANLLIQKIQHPAKNLTSIACQQAIETVGKLTQRHMDLLTCLFVVLKTNFPSVRSVEDWRNTLKRYLDPFAYAITSDLDVLRHLDATACIAYDTTLTIDVRVMLRSQHPELLTDPADIFQVLAGSNDEVFSVLSAFDSGLGGLKSCFLSNKGIAIAHANLARHSPVSPLGVWVS